jgi:hypothetical protein
MVPFPPSWACTGRELNRLCGNPCCRGFLQHRRSQLSEFAGVPGEAWLFFGCRRAYEDYLYRQEFGQFAADVAFSRAQVCSDAPLLYAAEGYQCVQALRFAGMFPCNMLAVV